MPKLDKYTESDFAKAGKDIITGDKITFLDGGTPDTGQYGERLAFTIKIPNGDQKKLTPNKTSLRELASVWNKGEDDPDTDTWVGKVAEVHITKQSVQGKLTDVIYLTPTGEEDNNIPVLEPEEDGKVKKNVSGSSTKEKVESKE